MTLLSSLSDAWTSMQRFHCTPSYTFAALTQSLITTPHMPSSSSPPSVSVYLVPQVYTSVYWFVHLFVNYLGTCLPHWYIIGLLRNDISLSKLLICRAYLLDYIHTWLLDYLITYMIVIVAKTRRTHLSWLFGFLAMR